MRRCIKLKEKDIYYILVLKDKKNISIKINKDGEIIVYAPIGISYSYIETLLRKKQNWIINNVNNLKNSCYNKDDKVIFLGIEYIRKIEQANKDKVYIKGDFVYIKTKEINSKYINKVLRDWYIEQAESLLINRVKKLSIKNNLLPSKIIIKNQKSRWGSCNSKKEIRLNWRLILMPYDIIDYIIIHELCHLKQMNHSKVFWNLVESIVPNYKELEKWLKENGRLIIMIE